MRERYAVTDTGGTRWADDPVRRREGWGWKKGKELDYLLEESLTAVGAGRGGGN